MGLDAASFLLETSPEKAQGQVDRLSEVMRKSLGEIRSHIHQISPIGEREELSSQLKNMAMEFAEHTKINIHFEYIGTQEMKISSQGIITFIRCLQESLTNAVRHGHAKEIKITLKEEGQYGILTIQDDGIGISNVKFGFGQNGMKERLEALQGGLRIESKVNEGTVITCFLPVVADRLRGEIEPDDKSVNCG
jgi:signal transduction histidine kinase